MVWIFLLSGLYLGWALGANDAANIFGTAVSSRMLKFSFAAIISGIFIILGAVLEGSGTVFTLGYLGEINAIAGSFTTALAASVTVTFLLRKGLPGSVSQAIVGAIIGWNIFTSSPTDIESLSQIVITWILNPVMAGFFAVIVYTLIKFVFEHGKIHLFKIDFYTRAGLILIAVFGSYSLGANNIGKVVGVFMNSNPFSDISLSNGIVISSSVQLLFTGALSMVVGIFTYSQKTIKTVGQDIFKITPVAAFSSIFASSLVLYLFSSVSLAKGLSLIGLPHLPFVPISITQSMIGAITGVAIMKGIHNINYKILGKIALGWIFTPIVSGIICLILLFIIQNVFQQDVYHRIEYRIDRGVLYYLVDSGKDTTGLTKFDNRKFESASEFRIELKKSDIKSEKRLFEIFSASRIDYLRVDSNIVNEKITSLKLSGEQINTLKLLHGKTYEYSWMLENDLMILSESWRFKPPESQYKYFNSVLRDNFKTVENLIRVKNE